MLTQSVVSEVVMSLFTDIAGPAITPLRIGKEFHPIGLERSSRTSEEQCKESAVERLGPATELTLDASATNLDNQFIIFQLNSSTEGPTILDSSEVQPSLDGNSEEPDVLIAAEMVSLHVARKGLEPDTRATLRMNFGKDQSSTDKRFDTVFWSIAAGLDQVWIHTAPT